MTPGERPAKGLLRRMPLRVLAVLVRLLVFAGGRACPGRALAA